MPAKSKKAAGGVKPAKAAIVAAKKAPVTRKVVPEPSSSDEDDDDFEGMDTEDEEADIVILTPSDDEDEEEADSDEDGEDYDSDESEDVDEEGMARLMKALGEDGLDEEALAALAVLRGEGEEASDEEEDDDEDVEDEDEEEEDDDEEDNDDEEVAAPSASKDTLAASLLRSGLVPQEDDEDEDEDEDEEDDEDEDPEADTSAIAVDSLTDAAFEALPDAVRSSRFHREKTNNKEALTAVREAIALNPSTAKGKDRMDWIEHMSVTWDKSVSAELEAENADAEDDLKRELTIYKQALHAATVGRDQVLAAGVPFSRPDDFFAEMVKSDSHMERIRQRLLDERAGIKASEEAKRQRELKKFGKKVQVEKQLERQKNKREMEEKIRGLKRKRGNLDTEADEDFDVRVESAFSDEKDDRSKRGRHAEREKPRMPRSARDSKYGFGGKKRHSKSNTKESTEAGFGQYKGPPKKGGPGGKGKKGGAAKRPGKSKRAGGRR